MKTENNYSNVTVIRLNSCNKCLIFVVKYFSFKFLLTCLKVVSFGMSRNAFQRLPTSWKKADITPLPKTSPVSDVNRHLRPISLAPILPKVGEELVVDGYIKPAILAKIDQNQYGTVPNSSTAYALNESACSTTGIVIPMATILQCAWCSSTLEKHSILSTTPFSWLSLPIMSSHLGCWTGLQIFLLTGSNE